MEGRPTPLPCQILSVLLLLCWRVASLEDDLHGPWHPAIIVKPHFVETCTSAAVCPIAGVTAKPGSVNVELRVVLLGLIPNFTYEIVVDMPQDGVTVNGIACVGRRKFSVSAGKAFRRLEK